ncbi:MAG: SpoIIE family protein phosphatase, partial [Proteobacteria bacterium]|nr:SpoIIE family protein phosphatase [Pseudomonadota bacterium]
MAIENAQLYANLEEKVRERTRDLNNTLDTLSNELDRAAEYVKRLIPEPLQQDELSVDWRFIPSVALGGDAFGYHWLDHDHFAIYLTDVSGHGVGAALLSVSITNVLRVHALPGVDFRAPTQVLQTLNATFP